MSTDTTQAAGPSVQQFAGEAPTRIAKRLFHATRPKFFPASLLPVLAGTAWGSVVADRLDLSVFLLALFATMCVHAGANVLNDVGDDDIGTDGNNDDRIYPYTGGSRFIQSGIMSSSSMARHGIGLLIAASVAGAILLYLKGPMILAFGAIGVLLAVLYSLGPARLSALGLGETAVGFAFGVLPVVGAAWLQSGVIDAKVFLFSLPISVWVAAILLINEVPDIAADAEAGKRTLPVRIGLGATAAVYMFIHIGAVGVVAWLAFTGSLPLLSLLVPAGLLVPAAMAARSIRRGIDDREGMTRGIEATLGIHTVGSLWLIAVIVYLSITGA